VAYAGRVVADTDRALTLREASYPPVQYVPLADVDPAVLERSSHTSYCPYKGRASYYSLRVGEAVEEAVAWSYERPHRAVAAIEGHLAFYPDRVDGVEVHGAG
jgi:uncharacterized protein (DUF427 family)